MSDMFTHKTREKMCAEIFDVFVICSLSGRTRARWAMKQITSNNNTNIDFLDILFLV